ncbi:hypothetical protein ACJRO7_027593 [Eucalyptus globulus]|uniref:NAC domain-containing protein n=1 Tax=Eucalyptus globulus TaxID=34317 RepID=A0ABD3JU77_EUCGL
MAGPMEARQVGYVFKPTEEQLVGHFLKKKLEGEMEKHPAIPEIYIYNWEPSELFLIYDGFSEEPSNERECYCFCAGGRQRTTPSGYWKETGRKRDIPGSGTDEPIGFKRIFVYHEGRQPRGRGTNVVNHEYHLYSDDSNSETSDRANPGATIQPDHPMEMPIHNQSLSRI